MKLYTQTYVPEIHMSLTPMAEIEGFPVRPGLFDVHGAMMLPVGVNFTVHTRYGTSCTLLLFHRDAQEPFARLPFPDAYKIGDVYSMIVFGLDIEEFEYAYQIDGPYDPQNGLVFDRNAVLLDPYARSVAGQRFWGDKKAGGYHARVVRDVFDWGAMPQSARTMSDLVIYELHVRGFTYHPSSGVKHPGTFAGLMEKIPYLKELGINAVELMPIFEFDETMNSREIDGKVLLDYWGYNTVGFFAPNISYISADEYNHEGTELKELIKAFHDNGIEVILDVVFNHTAEGNEKGATFCFKGFDNKVYYMLTPDGNYYNFSGCGNTLNCNHPIVRLLILECLRYWTVSYRIDGFRFDLASILGRNEDGSDDNRSWNCGCEGKTDDTEIQKLRFRMMRNACAVLMCSRGTPMFLAGDEFANSQSGNNNAYCQDNEISWLDWNLLEKNRELFEFFKFMIDYRFRHPVIRKKLPDAVCGMDPLHAHNINAEDMTIPKDAKTLSVSFAGHDTERGRDDLVYISVNPYWENVSITLPRLNPPNAWFLSVTTWGDENNRYCYPEGREPQIDHEFTLRPRSVAVFTGRLINDQD